MKKFTIALSTILLATSGAALAKGDKAAVAYMALESGTATIESIATDISSKVNGVIVESEFDDYKDQFAYEFKVVDLEGNTEYEYKYSVSDGSLLKEESESLTTLGFSDLDEDEKLAIQKVEESQFNIIPVITSLEAKYQAKLIEFELENKKGITFYEVKLFNVEQGETRLLVNVENGEEIPVINYKKDKRKHD